MSIRPIDLQVIIPRAQSNPNTREHVVNKEALQLQQAQMQNKRESIIKDNRVNALAQKDGGKVDEKKDLTKEKGKKKQMNSDTKNKQTEDQTNEKKPQAKDWNFHRFDMKV